MLRCGLESKKCTAVHKQHDRYTWPGSNWRPSACEADVIATRPQVLVTADWTPERSSEDGCHIGHVAPARPPADKQMSSGRGFATGSRRERLCLDDSSAASGEAGQAGQYTWSIRDTFGWAWPKS